MQLTNRFPCHFCVTWSLLREKHGAFVASMAELCGTSFVVTSVVTVQAVHISKMSTCCLQTSPHSPNECTNCFKHIIRDIPSLVLFLRLSYRTQFAWSCSVPMVAPTSHKSLLGEISQGRTAPGLPHANDRKNLPAMDAWNAQTTMTQNPQLPQLIQKSQGMLISRRVM